MTTQELCVAFAVFVTLAGCTTTQPQIQTECLDVGSNSGTLTLCPLPAGIVCVEKTGGLSCFQLQDPVLRADGGR